MYVGISLIIYSLIYSMLILLVYFIKKRVNTEETRVYNTLMISNIINLVLELLCCYTVYNQSEMMILNEVVNRLFLISIFTWQSLFTLYIYIVSFKNKTEKLNFKSLNGKLFLLFSGISLFGLMVLPLKYYNNMNMVYSYGEAADLLYVIVVIYLVAWIVMYITKYNKKENKKYIPIIIFMIVMTLALFIRAINPGILIISASFAFVTNLMYFTVENPDMKLLNELHESKEISDTANDEKTMFIYNMSQESRKVTNDINEIIKDLLVEETVDGMKDKARDILNLTAKYSNITYDILGVPEDTTTNFKLYKEKYSIKNLLKEVVSINMNKCQEKGIDLRINIDHNLPDKLYGDSIKLKENINKLIDVSLNNTIKGFIELSVAAIVKEDICRLFITIEDTGNGYNGEELTNILNSNKEIALINKNIIRMNGALSITSSYGIGSKIKLIIDQKVEKLESEITKYEKMISNINILLIDDSEATVKIFEKLLKGNNIKIDYASNSKEAISLLKEGNKYQVIFIDEELKEITGEEVLIKLKQIRNFNMRVVLLTKNNNYEYNNMYLKKGFNNYLLKPIDKNKLIKIIDE